MTSQEYEMVCKTLNELHQRLTAVESTCSSHGGRQVDREASSAFKPVCEQFADQLVDLVDGHMPLDDDERATIARYAEELLREILPELLEKAMSTPA